MVWHRLLGWRFLEKKQIGVPMAKRFPTIEVFHDLSAPRYHVHYKVRSYCLDCSVHADVSAARSIRGRQILFKFKECVGQGCAKHDHCTSKDSLFGHESERSFRPKERR